MATARTAPAVVGRGATLSVVVVAAVSHAVVRAGASAVLMRMDVAIARSAAVLAASLVAAPARGAAAWGRWCRGHGRGLGGR